MKSKLSCRISLFQVYEVGGGLPGPRKRPNHVSGIVNEVHYGGTGQRWTPASSIGGMRYMSKVVLNTYRTE